MMEKNGIGENVVVEKYHILQNRVSELKAKLTIAEMTKSDECEDIRSEVAKTEIELKEAYNALTDDERKSLSKDNKGIGD